MEDMPIIANFKLDERAKQFELQKFTPLTEGVPEILKKRLMDYLVKSLYDHMIFDNIFMNFNLVIEFRELDDFARECDDLYERENHLESLKMTPEHLNRGGKKVQSQYFDHQAEVYLRRYVQTVKTIRRIQHNKEEQDGLQQPEEREEEERAREILQDFWYNNELDERKRRLAFEKEILAAHKKYLEELLQIPSVQKHLKAHKDPTIMDALKLYLPKLAEIVKKVQIPQERKSKLVLQKPKVVPKTEPPFQTLTKYTDHEFYLLGNETSKIEYEEKYGKSRAELKKLIMELARALTNLKPEEKRIILKLAGKRDDNDTLLLIKRILMRFALYEAIILTNRTIVGAEERIEKFLEFRRTQMDILNAEYSWLTQLKANRQITEFPTIFLPEKNKQPHSYKRLRCDFTEKLQTAAMVTIIKMFFTEDVYAELVKSNAVFRSALGISSIVDAQIIQTEDEAEAQIWELCRQWHGIKLSEEVKEVKSKSCSDLSDFSVDFDFNNVSSYSCPSLLHILSK